MRELNSLRFTDEEKKSKTHNIMSETLEIHYHM